MEAELDSEGFPLIGPRVGDLVWIPWDAVAKTGGNYRTVIELLGWTEETPKRLKFSAITTDGVLHIMGAVWPPVKRCHRGHDLAGVLDDGRTVLYVSPKGVRECRLCKGEKGPRRAAARGGKRAAGGTTRRVK